MKGSVGAEWLRGLIFAPREWAEWTESAEWGLLIFFARAEDEIHAWPAA